MAYREKRHMLKIHESSRAASDNEVVKKGKPFFWWVLRINGKQVKFYSEEYPTNEQIEESRQGGQT